VVTWKTLVPNILQDQKRIYYTFPLQLAHGKNWIPTLAVVGVTAGLVALDPTDTPYFRRTSSLRDFNNAFSGTNMTLGTIAPPVALYLVGLARHDEYTQSTAFLAGESLVDCQILAAIMKGATRRLRPSDFPPNGDFSDSWFRGGTLSSIQGAGSFPSGHTIAAFAVATVIARRYPHHHWVAIAAYGIASLVGVSRVTNQAHFPSDVFMGAALGYAVSRFVVLHRY
jgi:membrane-associated phospholipid phosphatase